MKHHLTAALRPGRWKVVFALALASVLPLAAAGGAQAQLYPVSSLAQFNAAITAANTNAGADTIQLTGETLVQPTAPVTITDTLTITGDHAVQQGGFGGPTLDLGAVQPTAGDSFTVALGVNVSLQGFTVQGSAQDFGYAAIRNKGTLYLNNMLIAGNSNGQLQVTGPATTNINNTTIDDGSNQGIITSGTNTLNLNNSTVAYNFGQGILNNVGTTLNLKNSIVAGNAGAAQCNLPASTGVTSLSSDTSCLANGNGGGVNPKLAQFIDSNGGPSFSLGLQATSPAIDAGANCFTVDQRFFLRTGACDIGSFEVGAVQDTVKPSCVVTGAIAGPPKQQLVTLSDGGSGIYADSVFNVANSVGTQPTIPAFPTAGATPYGIAISNGSVAFSPLSFAQAGVPISQGGSNLVLTATKTDQLATTRWAFTATDWAGNTQDCR